MAMIHMANDSHLFHDAPASCRLPLYEPKLMHQFDHRWAICEGNGIVRDATDSEKSSHDFLVTPRYWIDEGEVVSRLAAKDWSNKWFMGWRGVTATTNERTFIATVLPFVAAQHNLLLFSSRLETRLQAALLACMNTLILDFVCRTKMGSYMSQFVVKQLPVLGPSRYNTADLAFIVPRVLELTYTAHDLQPWAADLGYDGPPFPWNPDRRTRLRAELDAYYARLYDLTRDELRYILDPADVMGADYPSETFRVLKNNETRQFGEYRTRRLVLEAWDQLSK
jgi:hypothetical protein